MSQENISKFKNKQVIKSIIVTFSQRFMNIRLKCFYVLNFNISKTLKKEYAFKTLIKISLIKTFPIILISINFLKMLLKTISNI